MLCSLLYRRLTEIRQDVGETKHTIKNVLETEQLAGLCLTELEERGIEPSEMPRSSESMKEAALLLQSYERQISTLENALKVCFSLLVIKLRTLPSPLPVYRDTNASVSAHFPCQLPQVLSFADSGTPSLSRSQLLDYSIESYRSPFLRLVDKSMLSNVLDNLAGEA